VIVNKTLLYYPIDFEISQALKQFIKQTYTNAVQNAIIPTFSIQKGNTKRENPNRFLYIFKKVMKFDALPDSISPVSCS
jgi:hypothetical protein